MYIIFFPTISLCSLRSTVYKLFLSVLHSMTMLTFFPLFFSQGIIVGPGEFAEGVARGVKSLLGHVIGILVLEGTVI